MRISIQDQLVSINNQRSQTYLGPIFGIQTSSFAIPGQVYSVIQQPDGKIIIGGRFRHYGDTMARNLIRILPDGTVDPDFNIGEGIYSFRPPLDNLTRISDNSRVLSVALQPDGKIVAVGNFFSASGVIRSCIVRYTNSGSIDPDFNVGSGIPSSFLALVAAQSDNKIIVTASGLSYSGSSVSRIFRINQSGSLDTTFNTGAGLSRDPEDLIIQSDGKIVVTGLLFDNGVTYSGSTAPSGAIRILPNGNMDPDFFLGDGFSIGPYSVKQQSDGKLLFGGIFSQFSGSSAQGLVRLLPSGARDTTFPNPGSTLSGQAVYNIVQQQDSKIVAVATSTSGNAATLFRFNISGGLDSTLSTQNKIRIFSSQVATSSYIDPESLNITSCIQLQNQNLIVGGKFTNYSESLEGRYDSIVSIQPSGNIDLSISFNGGFRMPKKAGFNTPASSSVNSIIQQPDGKILIGGSFTRLFNAGYPTSSFNRIIRLLPNGKPDPDFNIGTGFNEDVTSLFLQSDGKILATGYFTNYSGSLQNRIVRINPSGNIDQDFITGQGLEISQSLNDYYVKKFTVIQQQDQKIVIAGAFSQYNTVSSSYIVRVNNSGSVDPDFNIGAGFNNYPTDIIQQSDSKLVVVGRFSTYSGSTRAGRITRINQSGTIDLTFSGTSSANFRSSQVNTVYQQKDQKLLFGGSFDLYSGSNTVGIARADTFGRIDPDFSTNFGFQATSLVSNPTVYKIVEHSDGTIYVGGIFQSYATNSPIVNCSNLIRLSSSGSLINNFSSINGIQDSIFDIKENLQQNVMIGGVFTNYQNYLNQGFLGVTSEGIVSDYPQTDFKNSDLI